MLVSSIADLRATPGHSAYSTSKSTLRGLCVSAATDLGQYHVRVNTLRPCGVDNPRVLDRLATGEDGEYSMLSTVPLGQWA